MTRALPLCFLLAACASPSRILVQIDVAADASEAAAGPTLLSVYTAGGRILDARAVPGTLPGDVVVLLDDDAGEARVLARVLLADGATVASGIASGPIVKGKLTRLGVLLSTIVQPDADGDLVPDAIDECPLVANPEQRGCEVDGGVICGNGVLDVGEGCDEGPANGDDPASLAKCTSACRPRSPCGDTTGAARTLIDPETGHCYAAWTVPLNYTSAERACLLQGGHLAAITSARENALVQQVAAGAASWIGVVTIDPPSMLAWSTGETSTYQAFRAGEPSAGREGCAVLLAQGGEWESRACGWPAAGGLPASPSSTAFYICEHRCGDGVVDPGEACDPPGPSCTSTCRTIAACSEPGGRVSPATGACYFKAGSAVSHDTARTTGCPAGTHLASPNGPLDTAVAIQSTDGDSWIAVRAKNNVNRFDFDFAGVSLDAGRYHGFVGPDPDQGVTPACVVLSSGDVRGDGWRDRTCGELRPSLCQRD